MEFICLGSGSSGNAYIIKNGNECVLLECGFEFPKLIDKLLMNGIELSQIKAVVVSHKHSDHAKCLNNFINMGFNVYCPASCLKNPDLAPSNVRIVKENSKFKLAEWLKVLCFETLHDVECYGYIFLDTTANETMLFITDTKFFDFKYKDYHYDYIFIECNHIRKRLEAVMQKALDNHKQGDVYKYKRQSAYHLSLYGTKLFLKQLNLTDTKAVFLIHLSKEVCDDVVIKTEINKCYGCSTYVCFSYGGMS